MFIPVEGEDCVFLEDVVALVREGGVTAVYYADGRVRFTGFRPCTLARRLREMMSGAARPRPRGGRPERAAGG